MQNSFYFIYITQYIFKRLVWIVLSDVVSITDGKIFVVWWDVDRPVGLRSSSGSSRKEVENLLGLEMHVLGYDYEGILCGYWGYI